MPTVFYAWQSDHDPSICRSVIRDAAKLALKKLKSQPQIASAPPVELDQDRKGVPGHPHIASVIRKKIKACDVFLADLTHVADYQTYDGRSKRAQNPNVLIELGIAIRAKGFERLVLVMNTAFGSPADLPFDLKSHSFPISYDLPDSSDPQRLKDVRAKLANDIAIALKPMLAAVESELKTGKLDVEIGVFPSEGPDERHVRWLALDVTNRGHDLNDFWGAIETRNQAGKAKLQPMTIVGEQHNPFRHGYSCRFHLANADPSQNVLDVTKPEDIAIVILSAAREVVRIPATKWRDKLEAFAKSDPSLPPKPAPKTPARHPLAGWLDYRKW